MNKLTTPFNFEISCLSSNDEESESMKNFIQEASEPLQHILQTVANHDYSACLKICMDQNDFFESIIKSYKDKTSNITANTNSIECLKSETERKLWWFSCGVSCIQLFVQLNWTGPASDFAFESKEVATEALECLGQDGQVYHLVQHPFLLLAAQVIFSDLIKDSYFQTTSWWLFRCLCIQSQLMLERSESLFQEAKKVMEAALASSFFQDCAYKSLLFQFYLECGLLLLHYYDHKEADKKFEAARKLSGIEFSFTGALGVRTKFQTKPVSQLQILVKRTSEEPIKTMVSVKSQNNIPKNISLDDEVLLNKVKLVDENDIDNPVLQPEEYCMILAACTAMQKTNPAHRLKEEKIQAVIEFLLSTPSCWCVHSESLRLRCLNEKDRSRTVERSMKQLDDLVQLATHDKSSVYRLDLFYAVRPPPLWNVQKDLAKLYTSLGAVSSALQVYEKLEMWEDAILCLIRTDRSEEAMRIINTQLKVNENANLWCLLGDIMQEPKHYLKAWEFSKCRSSRAMTSLGYYYVSRKEFKKAIDCFEKSLSVLSLQMNTWFTMGCALLRIEEYHRATHAFRRCVGLEWDNFQAWTNLSAAYVRCNKKDQAFKTLTEAIKCNFDKWELWENYVAISVDTGHFNDAISAYNKLLELKKKFVDIPVLNVLVRAVTEDIADCNGKPGSCFKPKLLSLLGHVTSQTTGDPRIWELYAKLCGDGVGEDETENEKALQFLHKTLRTGIQKAGWEKEDESIKSLVNTCHKLTQACSHCRNHIEIQSISSIRLTINGLISRLKQREKSLIEISAQENFMNIINETSQYITSLDQILSHLKQSK